MRRLIYAIALMVPATGGWAQGLECNRGTTQMALNICAQESWEKADAELNRLWKILKPRADRQGWGQRLLTEQRTWLRARDARCEAERDDFAGAPSRR